MKLWLFACVASIGCAATPVPATFPSTYDEAVHAWHRVEDVNAWIGERFTYDGSRALALSESRRPDRGDSVIYEPAALYGDPHGVCVDLARFGYETTKTIVPGADPHYLMIEFEPVTFGGEVLRRHWLVIFSRGGNLYSFADSKRPGHIAGPFASLEDLIADDAQFRQRKIVSATVMDDFKMKVRQRRMRAPARSEPG